MDAYHGLNEPKFAGSGLRRGSLALATNQQPIYRKRQVRPHANQKLQCSLSLAAVRRPVNLLRVLGRCSPSTVSFPLLLHALEPLLDFCGDGHGILINEQDARSWRVSVRPAFFLQIGAKQAP